jgi:hypothetical protein
MCNISLAFSGGTVVFAELDPFRQSREDVGLLKYKGEDNWGPQPPKKKPGDAYVIAGAMAGIVVGAVAGFAINFFLGVIGIVAGGVAGALAGFFVLSLIRRRRKGRIRRGI